LVAEVFAGIGALKTAFDIAKGLKDLDDATKRNAAIIDLQQIILTAQQAQMDLLNEASELRAKLKTINDKRDELSRYELIDVRGDGKFAYRLRADAAGSEPIHLACPSCFKNGHVAILQFRHKSENQDWFDCLACKSQFSFGERVARQYSPPRTDFY
jgi:hypothetical protein